MHVLYRCNISFFDSLCGTIDVSRFAILDDGRWRCSLTYLHRAVSSDVTA
ncbi:hypothetical protein HMPREF3196_02054 [Bifidobacterium bifidum]|uniref:Uncharacterized protein n=1 Tax=Bifidobacterium bifidum TaxID=1681 RepID=A0A133KKG7_BIFBI|nr:hypothetical protein HMPREF3196_02054 [Bifidobacterium bifidum]